MKRAILCLARAAAAACGRNGSAPVDTNVADAPVAPEAPAPEAREVTTQVSAAEAPTELAKHMDAHFKVVREIERAAVAGDVATMRKRAKWLAEDDGNDSVAYKPELDEMREVARRLSRAADLAAAIPLAAELGAACGSCHQTMTTITSFEFQELPAAGDDLAQRMNRHLWAVDRLWEGLVGPSTSLWKTGAGVLADEIVPAADVAKDPGVAREVARLANQLQRLGDQARGAASQADRANVYGQLLTTCSSCHGYVRGKAEPIKPVEPGAPGQPEK